LYYALRAQEKPALEGELTIFNGGEKLVKPSCPLDAPPGSMTLGWGIFVLVLWIDTGELEDGAEVAPVSGHGVGDRGFYSLKFFFFLPQFALGFLSLLRS